MVHLGFLIIFLFNFLLQFQSHQIFHMFVIAAALVHYRGIQIISHYRLTNPHCPLEWHLDLILQWLRSDTCSVYTMHLIYDAIQPVMKTEKAMKWTTKDFIIVSSAFDD